jgi:hypothetical protein
MGKFLIFNHNRSLGTLVGIQFPRSNTFVAKEGTSFLIASELPDILYIKLIDCEDVLVHGLGPGIVPLLPHKKESIKVKLANNRYLNITARGFKVAAAYALTIDKCQVGSHTY